KGDGTPSLYWECEQVVANEADYKVEDGLKVYPNPVTDGVLNIISQEGREYSIFDFTGKLLKRGQLQAGSTAINLKGLKAGIYVLEASGGTGSEAGGRSIKIVVK
ncbi:MAG: T9SS type A sorting domain-containing protein, partial [Bacteroidales bacterium]|nr:T9SS type A sorting domain-containing protein [Bacteroidales bacterium]